MVIDAREATIRTATVEVRCLTVSGKQVTLALFRQLQEDPIEIDSGELRGEMWGRVNYHWEGCKYINRRHHHVVWQLGAELRKCVVEEPRKAPYCCEFGHWLPNALLNGWRLQRKLAGDEKEVYINFNGRSVAVEIPECAKVFLDGQEPPKPWETEHTMGARRKRTDEASEALLDLCHGGLIPLKEANQVVIDGLVRQDEEWAKLRIFWESVCALPQLFIAV